MTAKGTIKIPDEVETQIQTFLNRKRVSSHDESAENPHWPVMGQHELESLFYDYLFTILNGVIQPQKMDQKFEEVESYIQETCGRFLNGCI